jgi:hypothetical protein
MYFSTVLNKYSHFVRVSCLRNCVVPLYLCCFLLSSNLRQSTREGGKFSRTHRPPLPLRKYSCHSFLALMQKDYLKKIKMTQSVVEPAVFRLVAQCLNPQRHQLYSYVDRNGSEARGNWKWQTASWPRNLWKPCEKAGVCWKDGFWDVGCGNSLNCTGCVPRSLLLYWRWWT